MVSFYQQDWLTQCIGCYSEKELAKQDIFGIPLTHEEQDGLKNTNKNNDQMFEYVKLCNDSTYCIGLRMLDMYKKAMVNARAVYVGTTVLDSGTL